MKKSFAFKLKKTAGLLMLCVFCMAAGLLPFLSGTAAADSAEKIRVFLQRFETDNALKMTVSGQYMSREGDLLLADGSQVEIVRQGGRLILHSGTLAMDAGKSMEFLRVAEDSSVSFNETANRYAGDLCFKIEDGKIRTILTTDIETYVFGVVPYEMGESFPLEALKAQAVAARTYALACRSSDRDYDVVDNTNDQVYRGYTPGNTNCEKAVQETEGAVALYKGKYAVCYYTASNGGQIEKGENAWPEKAKTVSFAYMEQKDDPYDLANERSTVRRTTLSKKNTYKTIRPEVQAALIDGMTSAIQSSGVPVSNREFRIDSISEMQACMPRYGEDSRVMTGIHLKACLSYREKAEEPASAEETLSPKETPEAEYTPVDHEIETDVLFFGNLEQAMGLSINGSENELLTITETGDAFLLETRRFGHGIGMSQRGAEQMALEGKTWRDILAFYYPGLEIEERKSVSAGIPTPRAELIATPVPTPTTTPRPTLIPVETPASKKQGRLMQVDGIAEDSTLNLRESPSLSAVIVRRLYKGQRVVADGKAQNGWIHVRVGELEGYVRTEYLTKVTK